MEVLKLIYRFNVNNCFVKALTMYFNIKNNYFALRNIPSEAEVVKCCQLCRKFSTLDLESAQIIMIKLMKRNQHDSVLFVDKDNVCFLI